MITAVISDFYNVLLVPKSHGTYGFNDELFTVYKNISAQASFYIFTSSNIQDDPDMRNLLDPVVTDIFTTQAHNLKKNDPAAYTFIINKLQKMPQTFLFIDDLAENVEAAKEAGMHAIQYKNNQQIIKELQALHIY